MTKKTTRIDDETLQRMCIVLTETNHNLHNLKDVPVIIARMEERFAYLQKTFDEQCDNTNLQITKTTKTLDSLCKRVDQIEARQDKLGGIYAVLIPLTGIVTAAITYLVTRAIDKIAIFMILIFAGGLP